MRLQYLLLAILAFADISIMQAQEEIPQYIFAEPSSVSRQYPSIDQMSDGTLVLSFGTAGKGPTVDMKACISTDAGTTWSQPFAYATVNNAMLGLQRRPHVMIDRNGMYHAVFEDYRDGMMTRAYHSQSTDSGATWSKATVVVPNVIDASEDFISAAIDSTNSIIVTFLSTSYSLNDHKTHVYLVRSSDNGTTWSVPQQVDRFSEGGSCECCQQSVDVSATGRIVVAFRANINNRRDIHIAISDNDGETFEAPVLIQAEPWHIDGCPSQGPSVSIDNNNNVHVAWVDARDVRGVPVAYYAFLESGQLSVPTNVDLSSALSSTATYPYLSTTADGVGIVIVWESSKGVYEATSQNRGLSFQPRLLDAMTVHNGNVSTVWKKNGQTQSVWQANRDGHYDIRTSYAATSSVTDHSGGDIKAWCTSDGTLHVNSEYDILSVDAVDVAGRTVNIECISTARAEYRIRMHGILLVTIRTTTGSVRRMFML